LVKKYHPLFKRRSEGDFLSVPFTQSIEESMRGVQPLSQKYFPLPLIRHPREGGPRGMGSIFSGCGCRKGGQGGKRYLKKGEKGRISVSEWD